MATLQVGSIGEALNLLIKQGSTFGPMKFEMVQPDDSPVDLTGCVIQGHIRRTPKSTTLVSAITCTITDPAAGKYELSLSAAETRAIKAVDDPKSSENRYVWDLELLSADGITVTPLYYGEVVMFREVTR